MTQPLTVPAIDALNPALALDLAARLDPVPVICARHDITEPQLRTLLAHPPFRAMVAEAKRQWESIDNAQDRVRAKAALAVEDTIKDVHSIVVDESVKPNYRSDAWTKLAKIAGLEISPHADTSGNSGFSLTINLPGPEGAPEPLTIDAKNLPARE